MSVPRRPGRPPSESKLVQFSARFDHEQMEKVRVIALAYGVSTARAVALCVEQFEIPAPLKSAASRIQKARSAAKARGVSA